MYNIKTLLKNDKYKRLISNFSYLSIINIVNKVLPLVIVPYIVRTVGVEKYGVITFAMAIIMYMTLVTKYSFDLTATKFISLYREDNEKLSRYYSSVLMSKFLLLTFVSFIFFLALFFVERFYAEKEVFLFTYILIFADILMPLCFFRGIEQMSYIALFNIMAKIVYAIGVFIFVHQVSDYIWIPLINSLTALLAGVYAQYYIFKKFNIRIKLPTITEIKDIIKEGKHIFFSNISVSLYSSINTILLGVLTNYHQVGIYSLAESIYNAFSTIIRTYVMVIYPHLAKYTKKTTELYSQAKKFFHLYIIILAATSLFLYISAEHIILFLFGEGKDTSIDILRILALSLLPVSLGGFFTSYLSLKSKYKVISMITFKTMIVSLILIIPMIHIFGVYGVAYQFLLLSIMQIILNLKHNKELIARSSQK